MTANKLSAKAIARQRLWTLHWIMAACFFLLFAIGMYMADLPREVTYRLFLYNLHKSLGVLVFGLLLFRIFLLLQWLSRQRSQAVSRRNWLQTTALHRVLYGAMLLVPISGYVYSSTAGSEISFFGIQIPRLFPENEATIDFARSTHFWLAYALLTLIGLHIWIQRKFLNTTWRRLVKSLTARSSKSHQDK